MVFAVPMSFHQVTTIYIYIPIFLLFNEILCTALFNFTWQKNFVATAVFCGTQVQIAPTYLLTPPTPATSLV